jgi:hypothetical protein
MQAITHTITAHSRSIQCLPSTFWDIQKGAVKNESLDFGTGVTARFLGRGGMKAERALYGSINFNYINTDICFLQLGENDISERVSYHEVVDYIMRVVDRLLTDCVKVVIVGALFPRFNTTKSHCTLEFYEEMPQQVNRCLQEVYADQTKKVLFWEHGRDRTIGERLFETDGVHLNAAGTSLTTYLGYSVAGASMFTK